MTQNLLDDLMDGGFDVSPYFELRSGIARNLFVLTGAGISAESGIPTFRGNGGLWEGHSVEDVASPEGFRRNPHLVHEFYNARRAKLLSAEVQPNEAHLALATLEKRWKGQFTLVTQNVDDLHERAGSRHPIHMHGELSKVRCSRCDEIVSWKGNITGSSICSACEAGGTLRPHVVWFGEFPLEMDQISYAVQDCDIFVSIGTSGNVYPAAGLVAQAPAGTLRVEINLEATVDCNAFDERVLGPATKSVPQFVASLLEDVS